MLSKSEIKLIKSLGQKKIRNQLNLFTVEGVKGITEFLNSEFILHLLYTTQPVFDSFSGNNNIISEIELKKISTLKTPNTALAIFKIPESKPIDSSKLIIALDNVRDPGNLGTIIRLCDWFGIKDLICNTSTVDCFNNKVVQATMGSLTRVNVTYLDLENYIKDSDTNTFGTFMNGTNIYSEKLPQNGIIIFGNEANGISESIEKMITKKLTIPQFGNSQNTESLNVATATAIILSEFMRISIER
jgi:TrmH family RNA methyltransferase